MKQAETVFTYATALSLALTSLAYERCPSFAASSAQAQPGWILTQTQALLHYDNVYVTKDSILVKSNSNTWNVLCQAPDWQAVIWNARDKVMCTVPYKKWLQEGFSINFASSDSSRLPEKAVTHRGKFGRYPALYTQWRGLSSDVGLMSESAIRPAMTSFTYVSITAFNPPLPIRQLIGRLLLVPDSEGLPVLLTSTADKTVPHLTTQSIRQAPIEPEVFRQPQGCKLMRRESQIWIKKEEKDKINDFVEMLGPGK